LVVTSSATHAGVCIVEEDGMTPTANRIIMRTNSTMTGTENPTKYLYEEDMLHSFVTNVLRIFIANE
jgi:hypothetical protein